MRRRLPSLPNKRELHQAFNSPAPARPTGVKRKESQFLNRLQILKRHREAEVGAAADTVEVRAWQPAPMVEAEAVAAGVAATQEPGPAILKAIGGIKAKINPKIIRAARTSKAFSLAIGPGAR
jgi:hypothetical protein